MLDGSHRGDGGIEPRKFVDLLAGVAAIAGEGKQCRARSREMKA